MKIRRTNNKSSDLLISAPAKINTYLRVFPQRPDGYHDLQTVFREVSLFDEFKFRLIPHGLRLSVEGSSLPADSSNLVMKALALLQKKLKTTQGMEVRLHKKIPMGAGLGGGSSDAAAALWAGWILWTRKKIPSIFIPTDVPPVLHYCAKALGSDVPFFLKGGTAWAEGRGEKLTFLPKGPRQWVLLIYPRVHVSTALAYRLLDEEKRSDGLSQSANSFESVVFRDFPRVKAAFQALRTAGAQDVGMSGSGSTVYGFVEGISQGEAIFRKLAHRPWDVFLVHTI